MRASAAARRYARALFTLAREEGRVDAVRGELARLCELLDESPELRRAVLRPLHPGSQRRAVLRALCARLGTGDTVQKFCAFLVDQRRIIDFAGIRQAYDELADEAEGRTRARVTSAAPLRDDQRARLKRALETRTGRSVELEEKIDASLIGGAIAEVQGLVFDGSLRTQLRQLRTSLTRGH
jgi:F-type H+-transporting ATPase subunit delta